MSLSTVSDIQTFCKLRYLVTNTDLDTTLISFINDNYQRRAKRYPWKQLIVENQATTTTQDQSYYELPNNFWQIEKESLRYDVSTTGNGAPMPIVNEAQVGQFKALGTISAPQVGAIVGGGTNTSGRRLLLLPAFSEYGKVVKYDYLKQPSTLAASTDTLDIPELGETVAWESLVDLAIYEDNDKAANAFMVRARDAWRTAFQSVSAG